MEEFVVSDLVRSDYVLKAGVLDFDGFVIAAKPDNEQTKELLSKLAEVHYAADDFIQTSIITEKMTIIIHKLVKNYALVIGCDPKSNLGHIRHEIHQAASRLDGYLNSVQR